MTIDDIIGDAPEEPTAEMRGFARNCRDMYVALTLEQFSQQQALTIIGATIAAVINKGEDE